MLWWYLCEMLGMPAAGGLTAPWSMVFASCADAGMLSPSQEFSFM